MSERERGAEGLIGAAYAAREASRLVGGLGTGVKNGVLMAFAEALEAGAGEVLGANAADMAAARAEGIGEAKLRRLELTGASLARVVDGVRRVAGLPDPCGEVTRDGVVPSGLRVRRVRTPLGVIAMIYEARPGVTADAFALCFKAGNACILKGGREAARSNAAIAALAHGALRGAGLPEAAMVAVTEGDRGAIREMLGLTGVIDLVIPRGGEGLIRFVSEHSRVPVVKHDRGVCHIYVDATADARGAVEVCVRSKASGPAACNAVECVLVHREIAGEFAPAFVERCRGEGIEVRGDAAFVALAPGAAAAGEGDWGREYLDLIVAARVVGTMGEAIGHIARYSSDHTEAILTGDAGEAERFCREVRSSCVLVNAGTRFNDGYELGLGAEIGISTSRTHAYGPMGLEGLTIERYVVEGHGQAR